MPASKTSVFSKLISLLIGYDTNSGALQGNKQHELLWIYLSQMCCAEQRLISHTFQM